MSIEQGLRFMGGVVVTAATLLAATHSPYWLILTGFAGINLLQSGLTNWCPMVWVLQRLGFSPCETVEAATG